jgi:hypothetical protein
MSATVPYAYGLGFPGVDGAGYLMRAAPGDWPEVHARHEVDGPHALRVDRADASLDLLERSSELGRVVLDRYARTAHYYADRPLTPDEFARPFLDTAATAFARWEGREAFHAGGFVADGGGWAVVGASRAGKSTLLGALAQAGYDVLGDELLVVDDQQAYASVRCVDLRPDVVDLLGVGELVHVARRGESRRLPLAPMEFSVPFRGWVFLAWADDLEVVRLPASQTVARVTGLRLWADVPTDPRRLLHFGSLPSFELRRPADGLAVERVVEELLNGVTTVSVVA